MKEPNFCIICEQELAPIFEGQEIHEYCQSCEEELGESE